MEASKFVLIGLVLTICAFICQLIGLASPYWIYIALGETVAYGNRAYMIKRLIKLSAVIT